jgi:hypothetical protein
LQVKRIFCKGYSGFNFTSTAFTICLQATHILKYSLLSICFDRTLSVLGIVVLTISLPQTFPHSFPLTQRLTTSNNIHLLIRSIAGNIIKHPRCQPVCPISGFLPKYKKYWWYIEIVAFIHSHTSEKVSEPLVQGERIHSPLIFHEICSYIC